MGYQAFADIGKLRAMCEKGINAATPRVKKLFPEMLQLSDLLRDTCSAGLLCFVVAEFKYVLA